MDVKRSVSRCFRGHNLHPRVTILYTLSAISFFPSDKFKNSNNELKSITIHYYYALKHIGHLARLREDEHLFRYRAYLVGNLLRCVCARAHLHALIERLSMTFTANGKRQK